MKRFEKFAPSRTVSGWFARVRGTLALVALAAAGCGGADTAEGELDAATLDLAGECTSTSQCKTMYGSAAYDCSNSGGGVCLCGSGGTWCSSLDDSTGQCNSDASCSEGRYCNFNQGGVCTPARAEGSHCTRDRQCESGSCVANRCQNGSGSLGPSDPGNPANYTGTSHWRASTGTLTFLTAGRLPNTHHGWTVPTQVKKIVIAAGVRVNGRFNVRHTMEIAGDNRKTSTLFGTNEQGYNKKNDGCGLCKSAVLGEGNITVTVRNLTSLNPYGFYFTGKQGAKFLIDAVDAIDDRGGHGNNSDGVSAANGTIVRNSYFETGDDVIKVYSDILVENTTIKMVTNTVPIQFGWGNYGSGARGTFRNLRVFGTSGRGAADNAMISARTGRYDKTIDIDGLTLENPNGVVMIFREAQGRADITIKNAKIDVKNFRGSSWSMNVSPEVCGRVYPNGQGAPRQFDCRR